MSFTDGLGDVSKMMKAVVGDITKQRVDAVVNAANGIGVMGAGVAGALRQAAGIEIQNEAKLFCSSNPKVTVEVCCYKTSAHGLEANGVKCVYHAVVMKYPGGPTSLFVVEQVVESVIHTALKDDIKSIAFPGLGTGIGRLNKSSVASIMVKWLKKFEDQIDIWFVDTDVAFINSVNDAMEKSGTR